MTIGYSLIIDELAIKSWLCYDPINNTILGTCHEHSSSVSCKFDSLDEAQLIMEGIKNKSLHFAAEVC